MPTTVALFRKLALSLPNAFESAHMGNPDFRVATANGKGNIFATLASQGKGCGNLKLTPEQQLAFVTELPSVFEPIHGGWGRMGMTHIHLAAAEPDTLLGALTTAHHNVVAKQEAAPRKSAPRKSAPRKAAKSSPSSKPAQKPLK